MKQKRRYNVNPLPSASNYKQFAIPFTPEKFTQKEIRYLTPFFTNINKPVFVLRNMPEEVAGALSSRYSRATLSMRRMFLDEYIEPIVHPEQQKTWATLTSKEKKEASKTRDTFEDFITFLHKKGGIEQVVNIQRGRKFFDKWLADYGDDSIAEMGGGIHLCIEGLSNVATKEIEDKRIGLSPIEKSSRYVQFWEKRPDKKYQYIVPGEIKGTKYEKRYIKAMNLLFDTYAGLAESYVEYIMKKYPKGDDETDGSFKRSRAAKRFDDIRDLLPFSTQTFVAFNGNGRAYEDAINRLLAYPIGEFRYLGQQMLEEIKKVAPSFVTRPETERGAEIQLYRSNIELIRDEMAQKLLKKAKKSNSMAQWVRLISSTPDPDVEILATFLFAGADGISLSNIRQQVKSWSVKKRSQALAQILGERKFGREEAERFRDRFKKVPRAFESAKFLFEFWGRGGDYRDLQRHRQVTQERQRFSGLWGYDLDKDVLESPFANQIKKVYAEVHKVIESLQVFDPQIAQYAVPFGYLQHWYMDLTAREIYWIVELRTGPQGREHYRQICQDVARQAKKKAPAVFQSLLVDNGTYVLSRRESEKKIELKKKSLGIE